MKRGHSIRLHFTVIFIGLMALAVMAVWCINTWFLEDYYQDQKLDQLEDGYRVMDRIICGAKEEGRSVLRDAQEELLRQMEELFGEETGTQGASAQEERREVTRLAEVVRDLRDTSNVAILIYDNVTDQTLISSPRDIETMEERVQGYILGRNAFRGETVRQDDNYVIQKTFDPRSQTFYLEIWGFFSDNSTIFLMTTPLESIRESVRISNRFLLYVGICVILAGSVLLYFLMKHMTGPIYRLSQLSERMSRLDFTARYVRPKHSTEEIDTLGNSMNTLSDRLQETIGKLQAANEQLQRDIDEKTQIDEMRKEFIANVSHELKTPIALIQGYAEGLVEGMAEDAENRSYYCGVIMDEAGKMNKMVRQLLTLTALEFGREQAVIERFDLTELVQSVLAASGLMLKQKEITVECGLTDPVFVMGDEFKIEEVVTNYLTNAVNHAQGEKRIAIRAVRRMGADGARIRVSVFNTGQPIPEEALPNLWTKFYKVDKARTRAYGGSGIGLSIVKAILESHRQAYGVENREDGVEFWFELACAGEDPDCTESRTP